MAYTARSGEMNRKESLIFGGLLTAAGIGGLALAHLGFHAPASLALDGPLGGTTAIGGLFLLHAPLVK